MRLTKRTFTDLAIWMIGFGVLVGIIFPIFSRLIGIPSEHIDLLFIIACIIAGITVGLVNILIARGVVGTKLTHLSSQMKYVNDNIRNKHDINVEECFERCIIPVDSDDVIGETSQSFNELVHSFLTSMQNESSIRKFTEIFTNELDIDRLSNKALKHLIYFSESSAGLIILDKDGELEIGSSYLIKDPSSLLENKSIQNVFSTNQRLTFDLTDVITIEAGLVDFHPKGVIFEPISYKNKVLGVIVLASMKPFQPERIEQLSVYAHGLSLGINNAILYDRLEQISILDPLTKTYNRRFGMTRLAEEFSRAKRSNKPLGVLMLDIDHFKKVNDTYGHIAGDYVLKDVTQAIKDNIRTQDILIRYGGEEFIVILPSADSNGVKTTAEKLRRIVEERAISFQHQDIKVTISLGGSSYPELAVTEDTELIHKADENLYQAKESGRNRSII